MLWMRCVIFGASTLDAHNFLLKQGWTTEICDNNKKTVNNSMMPSMNYEKIIFRAKIVFFPVFRLYFENQNFGVKVQELKLFLTTVRTYWYIICMGLTAIFSNFNRPPNHHFRMQWTEFYIPKAGAKKWVKWYNRPPCYENPPQYRTAPHSIVGGRPTLLEEEEEGPPSPPRRGAEKKKHYCGGRK